MSEQSSFRQQVRKADSNPPPNMLQCPYPSCDHHREGHGFPRHWNLTDHLMKVHDGVLFQSTDEGPTSEQAVTDGYLTDESFDNCPPGEPEIVTLPSRYDKEVGHSTQRKGPKKVHGGDKVSVSGSYLREMESMIRDLQRRVNACERSSPDSPVSSYNSSRRGSIDSIAESDQDFRPLKRRPRRRSSIDIVVNPPNLNPPPPPPPFGPPRVGQAFNPPVVVPVGGLRQEIMRWKQRANPFGDPEWLIDNESAMPDALNDLNQKPVLTVIREFDLNKQFWRRRLQIASPSIISLLKDLSRYDVDVDTQDGPKGGELHLTEPLMVLFHSRRSLREKAASIPRQVGDHVQLMCDFMRNEFGDVTEKLDELESAKPSGLITYPELWLLYAPGTIVYSLENGEYEAFVVDSLRGMQKRQRSHNRFSHSRLDLTCWSINYDGEVYGRAWSVHTISPFHGSREISSLDLVPENFLQNAAGTKAELVSRGKHFWQLQGQKFREYTGEMWSQHNSDEPERVMVDHLTYQRRNNWPISIDKKRGPTDAQSKNWQDNRFGRWDNGRRSRVRVRRAPSPYIEEPSYRREFSPERQNDRDDRYAEPYMRYSTDRPARQVDSEFTKYDLIKPDSTPDELTSLLCPQHVHGYCLRDKVWKELNVTQLQPVAFRKNAWDRLVLDEEYKDIIQAMVSSYVDKTAMLDDLVAGKGAGLVALLHGPPGSGKTLTAECVADSFEKPLYQVTCGDIGTDPERLEERLEEIFDYAVTWGAVLLLDEADIFLQDRDYANLERNALVSIFLRTLEYFNGVLFLTTNRVGIFDQAFQSRIHVTLGLPSLDQQRRTSVWAIFLQDLAAKGAITDDRYDTLIKMVSEKWSKEKLNGRQIRNAVRTALVVAEKKGEMVGEKEFETVLKIGREFEGYMGMLGKGEVNAGLEGFQEV